MAAAADYFYKNRLVAAAVSLVFNTVPIERRGGGMGKNGSGHLDKLLDQGWNLLLFPEGTRTRDGGPGRVRRGAAVLAAAHNLSIVPIRVTGTRAAMPPGRLWPKRLRGKVFSAPPSHQRVLRRADPPDGGHHGAHRARAELLRQRRRRPVAPRRTCARSSSAPPATD